MEDYHYDRVAGEDICAPHDSVDNIRMMNHIRMVGTRLPRAYRTPSLTPAFPEAVKSPRKFV